MFDWDEDNVDHIAEHHIEPEEAEEALTDPERIPATRMYRVGDERRRAIIGATSNGRILFVAYTRREGLFRVVTAYDAGESERRRYRRGRK